MVERNTIHLIKYEYDWKETNEEFFYTFWFSMREGERLEKKKERNKSESALVKCDGLAK